MRELGALPLRETIVVIHGVPRSALPAEPVRPGAKLLVLPDVADPDVGRALGAKLAESDILLFADGSTPAPAGLLAGFLWTCDGRADVALNDLRANGRPFRDRTDAHRLQEFLNASLNRRDLKGNSLAALPFAISRKAYDAIGPAALRVPAKAHAVAVLSGLRIATGGAVPFEPVALSGEAFGKFAGDHAEAWHTAFALRGGRLSMPDSHRARGVLDDANIGL